MQTTYFAAKAIEDHMFDAAHRSAPKRRERADESEKAEKKWAARPARPVINPS